MANEIAAAVDGLASLLEDVPGLRVHRQPPAALNELPAAVVLFESRGASRTLGGSGFAGRIRVVLAVPAADAGDGFDRLYDFMAQSGGSSIEAAAASDPTGGWRPSTTWAGASSGAANTWRRTSTSMW